MKTITLTDEDFNLAMEALRKHWSEQKKQQDIEKWNTKLGLWLNASISEIGLAETKTLIRNVHRDLRMMEEEEDAC